jgi:23S rRNA pseudouridine2605 synthase
MQRKPPKQEGTQEIRLNKYVAHCGITSRRKAAELVKGGRIWVNGQVETNPSYMVKTGDVVSYRDQKLVPEQEFVYILMNKPKDVITTLTDDRGRKTVMDIIGNKIPQRIYPVGRLDNKTTGLLLLTNDGDLAKKLSHPSHKVPKIYQATLDKPLVPEDIEKIRAGFDLEDGPVTVNWIQHPSGDPKVVNLEIHMGKNRIIRRIFEHFGYQVIKLDRTYYAGLTKKDLPRSWFRHLTEREVIMLKHFV